MSSVHRKVVLPGSVVDLHARVRREHLRWLCLMYLDAGRPEATTEAALLAAIRSEYADADTGELRRELDYLAERELLRITGREGGRWQIKLTYQGIDIVEYTSDCPPGIDRPSTQTGG